MAAAAVAGLCTACSCFCQCCACSKESIQRIIDFAINVVTCGQGFKLMGQNISLLFTAEEDPELKDIDLPVSQKRKVTDIIFIFILLGLLAGMFTVFAFSIKYENREIERNGFDAFGNICGYDKNKPLKGVPSSGLDTSKFDKVFLLDFLRDPDRLMYGNSLKLQTFPVCVQQCPSIHSTFSCEQYVKDFVAKYKLEDKAYFCLPNSTDYKNLTFIVRKSRCVPEKILKTKSIADQNTLLNLFGYHWAYNFVDDCSICAAEITWVAMIALLFTFIYIIIINGAADSACWFCFGLFFIFGSISIAFLWVVYRRVSVTESGPLIVPRKSFEESLDKYYPPLELSILQFFPRLSYRYFSAQNSSFDLDPTKQEEKLNYSSLFLTVAILGSLVFGIGVIATIIISRRNVNASACLFYEASLSLLAIKIIYILPAISLFCIFLTICMLSITIKNLTTVFESNPLRVFHETFGLTTITYQHNFTYTNWLLAFQLFAFYWLLQIFLACQNIMVCLVTCTWYFTVGKEGLYLPLPVASSRLFRKHLGTATLGALINSTFGPLKAPLRYYQSLLILLNCNLNLI